MTIRGAAIVLLTVCFSATWSLAAYHHEGETDSKKFIDVYPDQTGTKLDHCALCHKGGEYEKKPGKFVQLGSCQWCHRTYGYDASGGASALAETLNAYGQAYLNANQTTTAIQTIADLDSDGDGYDNETEINAGRFPGSDADYPGLTEAPYRIYTLAQLEAMTQHTQFMLMNTSRSGDYYAEYTGVPMKTLLDDAGILNTATDVTVYAPDGWSQGHPLSYAEDLDMYHVYGTMPDETVQYPAATYYYDTDADTALNPAYGWCDYSALSCTGRNHGDTISVSGGLKALLAIKQDAVYLTPGVLNDENKLDGSGPFRVVVPQKFPGAPDQSSNSSEQDVVWPYTSGWDHNAGSCTRSVTIIKVNPLPAGTTDIDTLEAGWRYIDQKKIIIYGAINDSDSNGNGIFDSEEGTDTEADIDNDNIPDFQDSDTASFRHINGINKIVMNTSKGAFANVGALEDCDPSLSQSGKPALRSFPYGVVRFQVTGLTVGETAEITMVLPEAVPVSARYYKISDTGWKTITSGDNDGNITQTLTLKDGDPETDGDGIEDGIISASIALSVPGSDNDGDDDSSTCFISSLIH